MQIGVPKEIKNNEFRVGLTPNSVSELVNFKHQVFIETNAGKGSGFSDEDYQKSGAKILKDAASIFEHSELIIKVKEPQKIETAYLRKHHTLFTYLHLAPDPEQTKQLLKSKSCSIAYETITNKEGQLPLLLPMSEIAGRMSIIAGASCLQKNNTGSGVLLTGVPGVEPATVVIIGGGIVGSNALQIASGMGARTLVLDKDMQVLRKLEQRYGNRIQTYYANQDNLKKCLKQADLVIGAVLVPGAEAPKIVSRSDLLLMKPGSVIVDVAVDQGGCFETTRPTTHELPTYIENNIVHYCVANMPGAYPRSSTQALNTATLPYILELANNGIKHALSNNIHLRNGLHTVNGYLCNPAVAKAQKIDDISLEKAISYLT
ncbi:MAG: alanine dehydrogenase [Oleiphilaceae bacterium]|jgi:alanine dehydrogenase